jgi:hypothetical protein
LVALAVLVLKTSTAPRHLGMATRIPRAFRLSEQRWERLIVAISLRFGITAHSRSRGFWMPRGRQTLVPVGPVEIEARRPSPSTSDANGTPANRQASPQYPPRGRPVGPRPPPESCPAGCGARCPRSAPAVRAAGSSAAGPRRPAPAQRVRASSSPRTTCVRSNWMTPASVIGLPPSVSLTGPLSIAAEDRFWYTTFCGFCSDGPRPGHR